MAYILGCIFIVLSLIKKESKIIFFAFLVYLWILFAWNIGSADYYTYSYYYVQSVNEPLFTGVFGVEPGFQLFAKFANLLGLNYNGFLCIYSAAGLLLIASTIVKFTKKFNMVLVLYFIFPFCLDVVQIRSFMAMAIMIFAVRFLAQNGNINIIKYVLMIFIAALFHNAAIAYLVLLLVRIRDKRKLFWTTCFLVGIVCVIVWLTAIFEINISVIERRQDYFVTRTSFATNLMIICLFAFGAAIAILIQKFILRQRSLASTEAAKLSLDRDIMEMSSTQILFADVIVKINIVIWIILPLVVFSTEFMRIYRGILPLTYIAISYIAITKIRPNTKLVRVATEVAFVAFVLLMFWFWIYYGLANQAFYPIFEENALFNALSTY